MKEGEEKREDPPFRRGWGKINENFLVRRIENKH